MHPVRGRVTYADGQPVSGEMAVVVFVPDPASSSPPPKSASGTLEPDGTFVLTTNTAEDGALPGSYRVVLKVWSDYRAQRPGVAKSYLEASTTPLRVEVGPDPQPFEFTVDR